MLTDAVAEHLHSHRLLFRDTRNVAFGPNGSARIRPVVDAQARAAPEEPR